MVLRDLRWRPVDPRWDAVGHDPCPEGGAHPSINIPSIGLEQPNCISYEPAFAIEVEWMMLASMAKLGRPDGTPAYQRAFNQAR